MNYHAEKARASQLQRALEVELANATRYAAQATEARMLAAQLQARNHELEAALRPFSGFATAADSADGFFQINEVRDSEIVFRPSPELPALVAGDFRKTCVVLDRIALAATAPPDSEPAEGADGDDDRDDGEKCDACGRRYRAIYRVPNDVWQLIAPKPETLGPHIEHQFGGLLCVECASHRAIEKGITLHFEGGKGWWPYGMWPSDAAHPQPPPQRRDALEDLLWLEQTAATAHSVEATSEHKAHMSGTARGKAANVRRALQDSEPERCVGRCPSCGSTSPGLHPAVQHEGEVQVCSNPWHERHPADVSKTPEDSLRSLASWLGVGGYNADDVDPVVCERKIRDGVEHLLSVERNRALSEPAVPEAVWRLPEELRAEAPSQERAEEDDAMRGQRQVIYRTEDMPEDAVAWFKNERGTGVWLRLHLLEIEGFPRCYDMPIMQPVGYDLSPDISGPILLRIIDAPDAGGEGS